MVTPVLGLSDIMSLLNIRTAVTFMKKLLSIPVVGAYLYGITTITQYGYNSFFYIPGNFVETSIRANIIYFFQLFKLAEGIAGLMRWWMWAILVLLTLTVVLLYFFHHILAKVIVFLTVFLLVVILVKSYNFGAFIASNTSDFLTLEQSCSFAEQGQILIAPVIYDTKAILVPIDKITKKLSGGFQVKEISELNCKLETQNIGKITK